MPPTFRARGIHSLLDPRGFFASLSVPPPETTILSCGRHLTVGAVIGLVDLKLSANFGGMVAGDRYLSAITITLKISPFCIRYYCEPLLSLKGGHGLFRTRPGDYQSITCMRP